jgi:hypothetical protein
MASSATRSTNQTQQVGDVNGHILGLARIPGIAFFPDGSTGGLGRLFSTCGQIRERPTLAISTTVRPPVSGSAAGSSATRIASDVIVLSADPFGSQSPPLGNLRRVFVFAYGSGPIGVAIWPLPPPSSSPSGGRRLTASGVIGKTVSRADVLCRLQSADSQTHSHSQALSGTPLERPKSAAIAGTTLENQGASHPCRPGAFIPRSSAGRRARLCRTAAMETAEFA